MEILNYTVTKKLLYLVLIIAIIILFFTAGLSYKKIVELTASEKNLISKHRVTAQLELLASEIKEAESNQRGFIITHDSLFLQAYQVAKFNVDTIYQHLTGLLAADKKQQRNVALLRELIDERLHYLEKNIILVQDTVAFPDKITRSMNAGKKSMDLLLNKINNMKNIEWTQLRKREQTYNERVFFSPLWIFVIILFSLFIFVLAFYKITRDLRKIKKANNQLLINKEIFEHSEEIAEISSWCWNLHSSVLTFSHNQYRLLGCAVHEFEPDMDKFMQFVHPDDRNIIIEGREKMLNDASSNPFIAYFRIIRKGGVLRYFKSIEKKIIDNFQNEIIIGINADITEQYLQNKIIEEKIFDLERSNSELSAFNHVASHDLQEPLRKVQIYISRIREKDFDTLSEKGQEYFGRVQVAANRMQKLINDLLLYSRTNKADKVFEPTDLREVCEIAKIEMAPLIEEKNATITCAYLPVIQAIPFQIQQLFNNLIGNSIKYSRQNTPPHIHVSSRELSADQIEFLKHFSQTKFLEITFADNGIGFDQQYADNIFKLFHRLHDDKSFSGTGIGLTICKKIVENHKGFIRAYGVKDQGATFKVYLPL